MEAAKASKGSLSGCDEGGQDARRNHGHDGKSRKGLGDKKARGKRAPEAAEHVYRWCLVCLSAQGGVKGGCHAGRGSVGFGGMQKQVCGVM